jgi:hypothetical protein
MYVLVLITGKSFTGKFAIFFFTVTGKNDSQRPYAMLKAPVPSITVVKQH